MTTSKSKKRRAASALRRMTRRRWGSHKLYARLLEISEAAVSRYVGGTRLPDAEVTKRILEMVAKEKEGR